MIVWGWLDKVGVDATRFQMGGQVFQVPRTTVDDAVWWD